MTWKEYFKGNSVKIPKEFGDKEITVDDCLKIIGEMSFTIKELFDRKKWHTGTPTEEGWYVCKLAGSDIIETHNFTGNNWNADLFEMWKKIEPYKESKK